MSTTPDSGIRIVAPGTALQQMCNYVAVAETKSPAESLRALILHTLFTFEEEKPSSAQEVSDIMRTIFGVDAPSHQVQQELDQLSSAERVHQPLGTNYVLTADTRIRVKTRLDQAAQLQERVKQQWLAEINTRFPNLDVGRAWDAMQGYLAKAFLRHGMQVAAFLDPSIELPVEYAASLSTMLSEAVQEKFDLKHRESAKHAISDFLASVGKNQERAKFIAECADGAANYFSLSVSPNVAGTFREKLSPLMLFCDTNFLFGILDLHVHPLVEVSRDLLNAISVHKLPINFKYHDATLREMQLSISHYSDILRRHRWSQSLSRAATTSRFMSGIELKYHQKNAESGVDVNSFLRPYQHVDVLLTQHGISMYRTSDERLTERATLEAEYQEHLKRLRKEKVHDLVVHDVAILDCVRSIRSTTATTLEAGALLVTCDYTLYRFDSDSSRLAKTQASVVLPNVLWQILRPFIPASQDFDRSFAETFAIPEFRTIGSGAAKACSKMLSLLATYKDFPEETAARLLSNDLLIDSLRATQNEEEFRAQVESAIASENQILLEERAALERQIGVLQGEKERVEIELTEQKRSSTEEIAKAQEAVQTKEGEIQSLITSRREAEAKEKETSLILAELAASKDAAEKTARRMQLGVSAVKRSILALGILLVVEFIIGYLAWQYGEGPNLFQKLTNSWPWLVAGFGAVAILYPFLMGRDRMRLLKWWKGDTE